MDKILYEEQTKYLENFKDNSDELIIEMEDYAKQNKVPILNWKAAEFLEHLVQIKKPKRVLELGMAIGYSSIRIARKLNKKSYLHTIEISKETIEIANSYIERSGVKDKIKILEGDAIEILPTLDKKYDFIFLDADKEDYAVLLDLSIKLLKKDGILFVDNLLWHGFAAADKIPKKFQNSTKNIRHFNEIFSKMPELNTSIYPIGDGIGIGIKLKIKKNKNNYE